MATQRPETPVELRPGDPAPDFSLPGSNGRTYRLKELAGRRGRDRVVSQGVHRWLNRRVQVARFERRGIAGDEVSYFAASVDPVEVNTKFAGSLGLFRF